MVLITAQLRVARPDWGQREVRNSTPGTDPHLGKLGWRHVLPMKSGRNAQNYGDNLDKINVYSVSSQVPISQEADIRFHSE